MRTTLLIIIYLFLTVGILYSADEHLASNPESNLIKNTSEEHKTDKNEPHTTTSTTEHSTSNDGHKSKEEGGLLGVLGIDIRVLLIQLFGFVLLLIVLKKFLFTPVMKALDDRREGIKNTLDKVENDRKEMERLKSDYEQRLSQIEAEARERIQKAVKEAQKIGEEIVNEKREESEKLIQKAKSEIEREKEKSLFELREEVAKLSLELAGKIIHRELSPQVHHDLIQNFINSIGQESRN